QSRDYVNKILPEDLEIRQIAHTRALITGNLHYEVRINHASLGIRWVKVSGKYLFLESGQPHRIIGVVQDITEQKVFAEELEKQVKERTKALEETQFDLIKSFQYLQKIINKFETALASLVPIFDGDRIIDFRFKMTNEAYSKYSRLPPSAIQNEIVSAIFPGYQKTNAFEKYVETYQTGKQNKWDLHYNHDGLDVHLIVVCNKIDDEVVVNL